MKLVMRLSNLRSQCYSNIKFKKCISHHKSYAKIEAHFHSKYVLRIYVLPLGLLCVAINPSRKHDLNVLWWL